MILVSKSWCKWEFKARIVKCLPDFNWKARWYCCI